MKEFKLDDLVAFKKQDENILSGTVKTKLLGKEEEILEIETIEGNFLISANECFER